jgi:hypothetical protein
MPFAFAALLLLASPAAPGSWYFAVAGDSRDCGDVVMPKIAATIAARQAEAPVAFYWHLGDFRRVSDLDCDILKRTQPDFDCRPEVRRYELLPRDAMDRYLDTAWDDFKTHQLEAFGELPVFLAFGNHEVYANLTREDAKRSFRKWLDQDPIHRQRRVDREKGLPGMEGDAWYHFPKNGVDFITLDNSEGTAFPPEEVRWLQRIVAADLGDPAIHAIVVGMHAALPQSTQRSHAMDASCAGYCSGRQVYDVLWAASAAKRVSVFSSHTHTFAEDIYDTLEHRGQVLPGWTIGTAGAEQYVRPLRYGYLEVEVKPSGEVVPRFREVTRHSPPTLEGAGAAQLLTHCFEQNLETQNPSRALVDCACAPAVP